MISSSKNSIYFDIAATTPLDQSVIDVMHEINQKYYGNPSSIHVFGQKAHNLLEKQRKQIASILSCKESEIFFTAGGTEANNIALKGVLKKGDHFITSSYEHPAILKVAKDLEKNDVKVSYVKPDSNGVIKPESVKNKINSKTKLVSIMYVNNELGTINPIDEIGNICKDNDILLHSDAVQYVGKLPIDLSNINVDLLSIGAHKFYGPKSIGLLYIKNDVLIEPLLIGGGQEKGIRPGTENITLIAGMGEALKIAYENMGYHLKHIKKMETLFLDKLDNSYIDYKLNGKPRIPGFLSISFKNIEGESLLMQLDMAGIAVSYGSACASGSSKVSSTLLEIGMDEIEAKHTIRISIGKHIKDKDIDLLFNSIKNIIPVETKDEING